MTPRIRSAAVTPWPRSRLPLLVLTGLLLAAHLQAAPVMSVSVDNAPAVSFELNQFCDGGKPESCFGFGDTGDLFISSFELGADPDPFLSGSIDFYNASLFNTISVVATISMPLTASYSLANVIVGTGEVTSVIGGGILNLSAAGFFDGSVTPVLATGAVSVCNDLFADPSCQNSTLGLTAGPLAVSGVNITSDMSLQLSFLLTPDTSATIGFDPGLPFSGGAYLSVVPVPLPSALVMLSPMLGGLGWLVRRGGRAAGQRG